MGGIMGGQYRPENQQERDLAQARQNTPEVQSFAYGLNTASQPYLLNQHTPYLLNFKFDSSGQTLYRRDGHKVFKSFSTGTKIIASDQALSGDIYYITKNGAVVILHAIVKVAGKQPLEYSIDISSFTNLADGDYIDNFKVITGFESGNYNVFPYFNIFDKDGIFKSKVNLKTDDDLSTVGSNDVITVTGVASTPIDIIDHSDFRNSLFLLLKENDHFKLAWGTAGSVALTKSVFIPNNEEVYALKAFADSVYLYCEDRIYRITYDQVKDEVLLDVHSEGYGTTSNKLVKAVGTTIFYYGESSGLAVMTGAAANSIADVTQLQRPIDNYVSNFHKVFRASDICYKKDDTSLYIIGSVDCDYIARAIHWQNVYCQDPNGMTPEQYENSFNSFKSSIEGRDRFILEYNIPLMRFSLHFYDKRVLGHYNMRLHIAGLEYDQSSELIFTEDYIATTHSDFTDDNGVEFPVQINTIPRNKGLFTGFLSSIYKMNVKFESNAVPIPNKTIYVTNTDLHYSITNKGLILNVENTLEHETSERITNIMSISDSVTSILPSHLIGFYSHSILIFDGVNAIHNTSSMNNI